MKKSKEKHPGGEALRTGREVVATFATDTIAESIKALPAFCASVSTIGWAGAIAGLGAGAAAPVVGCAMILGGTAYLKWKQDQRDDAELRTHFGELAAALDEINREQSVAVSMLAEIYERRRFVWAKIDGNDKQEIVDRVNGLFAAAGFDGTVTVHDLMSEIWEVRKEVAGISEDTRAIRRDQATKDDLAAMEQRLLAQMNENKKSQADPTQYEWPPELIAQAKVLRERGDKEQRAVAEIALRNHAEADRLIQQLKKDPIAETFRLLTLEGDNWYQANEPDKAVEPYEQALALRSNDITARNNATITHAFARLGDIEAHRRRAIELADRTLTLLDPDSRDWAATQNNLGIAWANFPTGDRADNLRRAIGAYEQALTVYTQTTNPADWAATKNNLGNAWFSMPTGDRADNLRRAIGAYGQALTVRTKTAHPADWATTQSNIGSAWASLPTGDRADNLRRAIGAYEQALTVYSQTTNPADWAAIQNNLGIAWANLPTGDRADNLRRAIGAYEQALNVYIQTAHPADWAMTQNNLGNAWANLPTGDLADNLRRAIGAYEQALTVRTQTAYPADWATTQSNLGNAWANLPTGDLADNLRRAIGAYEQALAVNTQTTHPAAWAMTQTNVGTAWAELANLPEQDACECLRRSIVASKGSLTVYTPDAFPREHALTTNNLAIVRRIYESRGCAASIPFDDIPVAE